MPKREEGAHPAGRPDVLEAVLAIRCVSRALKKEHRLRSSPSVGASYDGVTDEIAAARRHHRSGLQALQAAVAAGALDTELRILLQAAVQDLIRSAQRLGELT